MTIGDMMALTNYERCYLRIKVKKYIAEGKDIDFVVAKLRSNFKPATIRDYYRVFSKPPEAPSAAMTLEK